MRQGKLRHSDDTNKAVRNMIVKPAWSSALTWMAAVAAAVLLAIASPEGSSVVPFAFGDLIPQGAAAPR
jgi:hypothetical protein